MATGSQEAKSSLALFTRNSSGMVRELSIVDAAWYGVLAAGALFGLIFVFPAPQAFFAGVNLPVSSLIAMVFMPAIFAVYAGLGSAMPRMGGDYLYLSRSVTPVTGFSFALGWEVFMWVTFNTTGGLVVSTGGLQPLLYHLGVIWNSQSLLSASDWFGGATGTFYTILVLAVLSFATTVYGIAFYRKVQRYFIVPATVLSGFLLIVLLAQSHAAFISHFNAFYTKAINERAYSVTVQHAAAKAAFHNPGFSWKWTFLFLSVSGSSMWYLVYSAQGILGEVKQASNFKRLFRAFMVGGIFLGLYFWVIPTALFTHTVSQQFMNQYATAFSAGTIQAPGGASLISFVMMMTSSPVVLILLALGFVAMGYYFSTCVFLNMSRVLTAMGMDRSLPSWFADVNERYHAPIKAATVFFGLAMVMNILFHYSASAATAVIYGGIFTSGGMIAMGGLAGALFPYRAKDVYNVSPVAQYRLFGLPMITVAGIVAFLGAGTVTVMNLIFPELGFTTGWARILVVGSLVASAIWFYAYRAYLKRRRGINIDLTFSYVPPE